MAAVAAASAAATAEKEKVNMAPPNEQTGTGLLKLARRKSVSSFNTTLRIAHVADAHPKTADPRNRQSVLYRASPTPPLPDHPRSSSKTSSRADTAMEGEEGYVIGVAIGSPTEIKLREQLEQREQQKSSRSEISIFPPQNIYSNDAGSSSATRPTNKPFEIQVKGPVASGARRTLHKEREREKDRGREYLQEDAPKTGWRKMFGKGFFGSSRKAPTRQELEPTKKLELVTRDKLSPHLAPKQKPAKKGASPAPCLTVDIPEVEMERYSVMFGTLLHPSEKSTIFARRKSRDAVNKKQAGASTNKEPSQLYLTPLKRNATTGQVCRSPASMLDVTPIPPTNATSRTPSPSSLSRSKTTAESSPPEMYIVRDQSNAELVTPKAGAPGLLSHSRSLSKISKISEESTLDTDTPRGSFDEGDDEWMTKEDEAEPQWEMVTGPLSGPMTEDQIQTAAQISIARQISVSQRQLLIPIVPKSQRLVSRATIRRATANAKFPMPPLQQPLQEEKKEKKEKNEEQKEEVDQQKIQLGLAQ